MILLVVFFFILSLSTGLSSAAVLNVTGSDECGNFSTIKDAINNLSNESTILVYGGTYTENIRIPISGLTLKTAEGSNVVLKPLDPTSPDITILADNVTICGFNISGPDFGTGIQSQGKNGLILKDNTINTSFIGITLEAGSNCTLENNTIYGADFGVSLKNSCNNNSLEQNTIKGCEEGLLLRDSCNNNNLSENNFSDNFRALWLENSCSNNTLVSNSFVNNSISVRLEEECSGNVLENNTVRKAQYGFYLSHSCNNNTLIKNNASDSHYAYYLKSSCENNSLKNNTALGNLYGFYLSRSSYNTLYGNGLSNNSRGIYVEACDNTTLLSNMASWNIMEGVFLDASSDNLLEGNNVSDNSEGIKLDGACSRNTLKGNQAFGNSKGLLFRFTTSSLFRANNISFNEHGIIFSSSSNNTLNDSFVMFNSECGLSLENSRNNLIYNNIFNNTKNAEDDNQDNNSKNTWNISIIKIKGKKNIYDGPSFGGNYWSDYTGNDSDGDGFGDSWYESGNITDKLPLFDDVVPPVITVRTPREITYSIISIPIYAYANEELKEWKYTIDNKEGSFTRNSPLTAESLLNLSNGPHTLIVSGTDLSDNSNSTEVIFTVDKEADADKSAPLISIMTPEENRTYTTGNLSLYASANESIQDWWYELDNLELCEFKVTRNFTAQASLKLANGSHTIRVYGVDLAGNINSKPVNFTIVIKKPEDTVPPTINILSPLNESYSIRSIHVYTSSTENISRWWYTLDDSEAFEFNLSTMHTANDSIDLGNGTYTLEGYGVDFAGNLNSTAVCFEVELKKPEDCPPIITISSPVNITYNKSSIHLEASANESIRDWWYVLDNSSNLSFNNNRDFNASTFMSASDGGHLVSVWGRDLAGNLNSSSVNFKVDTLPPVLEVISPEEGWSYSSDTLMIFVHSNEKVKSWEYKLDKEGFKNFSEFAPCWADALLTNLSNEDHTIEIQAEDLAGNNNSTIVNFSVNTTSGDGTLPLVTIISPEEKAYPNSSIPLNASANKNISEWWYVLDSSGKLTFNISNNLSALSTLDTLDGKHRLKVYGKDFNKNLNASACNFTTDTKDPLITIISPVNGSEFEIEDGKSNYTVYLNVSLSESCNFSYNIINQTGLNSESGFNNSNGGIFNKTLNLEEGFYNITLLAEDAAGNRGWNYTTIEVLKNSPKGDTGSKDDGPTNYYRVLAALRARMSGAEDQSNEVSDGGSLELTPMLKNEEFSPASSNEVKEKNSIFSATNAGILLLIAALLILFIKYMMYFRREK